MVRVWAESRQWKARGRIEGGELATGECSRGTVFLGRICLRFWLTKIIILGEMASPRSKSPRPVTPKRGDEGKEESFWDKFGTLGRKKKIKEGEGK